MSTRRTSSRAAPAGRPGRSSQRGSVLLIAMIMLLMAAVLTATAFRGSISNAQSIGNMQWRAEAIAAANDAVDRLLSSADFATKTDVVVSQVNAAPFQVDINGDGINDIAVSFPAVTLEDGSTKAGPRCLRQQPIPAKSLDPEVPADVACLGSSSGSSQGLGIGARGGAAAALASSPSLCSNTEWTLRVRATDAVTNTSVDVVQGVGVRVNTDVAANYCD